MQATRRGDFGQGVAMSVVRRRHPGAAIAMAFPDRRKRRPGEGALSPWRLGRSAGDTPFHRGAINASPPSTRPARGSSHGLGGCAMPSPTKRL